MYLDKKDKGRKMRRLNIIICGIGGQGIILVSNILAEALFSKGYDVKLSETKGMSRRGGSVSCHIKAGKEVYSPLMRYGDTDMVICIEKNEMPNFFDYLNKKTLIIMNGEYKIKEEFDKINNLKLINADMIANRIGNKKLTNMILLGYLSEYLKIDNRIWTNTIKKAFTKKDMRELNLKAFLEGKRIRV